MNNQEHIKLLHQGEAFFSVALVGFPGAGKTTVGKQLARALDYTFLDTDILFGERYELPVNQFIKTYGETIFRKCEYDLLSDIVEQPYTVISCGGGTPCYANAMDLLLQNAFTVYIKMAPKSLQQRLVNSKRIRPLVNKESPEEVAAYIEKTLPIREAYYSRAHLIYKGEDFHIDELIQNLPIDKL